MVCLFPLQEAGDEFFYFYIGPLDDFRVQFPFSDFIADLLTTLNVALTQQHPNGMRSFQAFEFVCKAFDSDPTLGIFFSIF